MTTKDSKTNCPVITIAAFNILGTSTLTPINFVSIFVCVVSQLSNSITGQECLSQVLLGLLDVVLSGLSQRVTQCLTFKNPFEGLVKKAALQCTSLFSNTCLHLAATICGLVEWTWIQCAGMKVVCWIKGFPARFPTPSKH